MTEITKAGFLAYLILGSALLVMIATFITTSKKGGHLKHSDGARTLHAMRKKSS